MKFFVTGNIKNEKKLLVAITALALFFILFIFSDLWIKGALFGFSVIEVSQTLLGNEELFMDPYAFATLLEMIHTDLFFVMMLFILSGALYFRIKKQSRFTRVVMTILLFMVLISMVTPFVGLSYSFGAFLWYYSFIGWHLLFIYIYIDVIKTIWFSSHD